jgi:ADP-heptose:LPS heptosyltransferase
MFGHPWKTRSLYLKSFDVTVPSQTGLKRVLVIRIGRLGDTILATPVIDVLQRYFAGPVSIDFATSPGASALVLSMDKRVNHVFPVARRHVPWRFDAAKREISKTSRENPYDLVINLECGTECDDFIRFVHHHEFCGRPRVTPRHSPTRHCVDTEKSVYAQLLGADLTALSETSLHLQGESKPLVVLPDEDYVVINPGFSGIMKKGHRGHRAWPEEHWLKLINLINERMGLAVMINGTVDEQPYFSTLLQAEGTYSLFGSSLETLASALTHARCLVSVDTGTMHLAAALGTKLVALFGPGNPLLTGPYTKTGKHRILTSGVDCQPCTRTPLEKECKFNRCMSELGPEQVFESCQQLINAD